MGCCSSAKVGAVENTAKPEKRKPSSTFADAVAPLEAKEKGSFKKTKVQKPKSDTAPKPHVPPTAPPVLMEEKMATSADSNKVETDGEDVGSEHGAACSELTDRTGLTIMSSLSMALHDPKTVLLVKTSWTRFTASPSGRTFYSNLFKTAPGLSDTFFKGVDINAQGLKLMACIDMAVTKIESPDILLPALRNLGAKHTAYGTEEAHYPVVGATLLQTLKQGLGTGFTPEVEKAWTDVYGTIQKYMLEGAASPEGLAGFARYRGRVVGNKNTVQLVQSTWAEVNFDHDAFAKLFYSDLFQRHGELSETLFKGVDMTVLGGKLTATMGMIVANLEQPEELLPSLRALGAKHTAYGTEEAHYPVVGATLLQTLKVALGTAWTPEVKTAWSDVSDTIQKYMLEGAASPEGFAGRKKYVEKRTGVRPPDSAPYSRDAVSKHSTEQDLWIIVNDRIYDATKFVKSHPGGVFILVNQAGKESSTEFKKYHSASAWAQLETFFVANVQDS